MTRAVHIQSRYRSAQTPSIFTTSSQKMTGPGSQHCSLPGAPYDGAGVAVLDGLGTDVALPGKDNGAALVTRRLGVLGQTRGTSTGGSTGKEPCHTHTHTHTHTHRNTHTHPHTHTHTHTQTHTPTRTQKSKQLQTRTSWA